MSAEWADLAEQLEYEAELAHPNSQADRLRDAAKQVREMLAELEKAEKSRDLAITTCCACCDVATARAERAEAALARCRCNVRAVEDPDFVLPWVADPRAEGTSGEAS